MIVCSTLKRTTPQVVRKSRTLLLDTATKYVVLLHCPHHQRPSSVSYWSLENDPIPTVKPATESTRGKLLSVIAGGAWTKLLHVIVGVHAVIFSTKG